MRATRALAAILLGSTLLTTASWAASREENQAAPIIGSEDAILTDAPFAPPPIQRDHATKVVVHLEVKEVVGRLSDGVQYTFWTFGGHVPGKFIRIREGDEVEMHIDNHPGNKNPHNIDLHAVNGPGGGAAASLTAPGHSSVFSFKALNPGLFVYHCATAPVAMHVGNGMYGLILVEPKEGLPKVDREYYLMQGDFYTAGKNGDQGMQAFSMTKAIDEKPEYIVFNGAVGSTVGDKALTAKVGETVRLFVGDGGPNIVSSFHVIGQIFDTVYPEGNLGSVAHNVQTTTVPAGGSTITEFKMSVPGTFIIVDHSLVRAFNRGALAQLKVAGPEDKLVYSGKTNDLVYQPEGAGIVDAGKGAPAPGARSKQERVARGADIFANNCQACHQANGEGVPEAFPPLAKSDYLNGDKVRAIKTVTGGLEAPLVVNGQTYNGVMPAWTLSNEDVANVLSYLYANWGNAGFEVTPEDVAANRIQAK
ncbi:MAG: nitrite reductase, copper-containing [Pseudomonadota bacterium]|nr:nitrite reductase, copper-containing [Pseudomonadota bacterium]